MTFYSDLFTKLGKVIGVANEAMRWQNSIGDQYLVDIAELFTPEELELLPSIYIDFANEATRYSSTQSTLQNYIRSTLVTQQVALACPNTNAADLVNALITKMTLDSQTVNANYISTPSVGAIVGTGNGSLLASNKNILAVNDERIVNEIVKATCTRDIFSNANTSSWSLVGYPNYGPNSFRARGNGNTSITDMRGNLAVSNGDFENFSSNVPSSWTTVIGAELIFNGLTGAYRGDGCLKLKSDASHTTATLNQGVSLAQNTIYCMSVRMKVDAAFDGSSSLHISIVNDGVMTPIDLFAAANPTTLTTSYVLHNVFFALPKILDNNDFSIVITWTSANGVTTGKSIYIDDLFIAPAYMFGHVAYAIVPGSTEFISGDNYTITTTSSYEGVIQTFFGRYYNVQLPSNAAGGETISDSYAVEIPPVAGSGW